MREFYLSQRSRWSGGLRSWRRTTAVTPSECMQPALACVYGFGRLPMAVGTKNSVAHNFRSGNLDTLTERLTYLKYIPIPVHQSVKFY